jgi:hypothetical protein
MKFHIFLANHCKFHIFFSNKIIYEDDLNDESQKKRRKPNTDKSPKVAKPKKSNESAAKPARKRPVKEDKSKQPRKKVKERESSDDEQANTFKEPRLEISRDVFDGDISFSQKPWKEHELLAEMQSLDVQTAKNIIKLFKEDNTVPFICRYRKELIGDMSPDELREVKISYNQIQNVHLKAEVVMNHLEKDQKLTNDIKHDLLCAKTLDEIDHLYAPYKPASKGSLADRAKALGLEVCADDLLLGIEEVDMPALVKPDIEGLESQHKVQDGIQHIIAFKFSKNTLVLEELRRL